MIDIRERIGSAFAGPREAVRDKIDAARDQIQIIRDAAPTLTTALIVVVFVAGIAAGWFASKPFTRWAVNAEWRDKIAAKSGAVRGVLAAGNAEISATDDDIIEALGDTDARLSTAERALKTIRPATGGECRINADSLRVK